MPSTAPSPDRPRRLSVAVVGGSIAGCATAAMLSRAGHDVRVFERSANDLVGRGGGIATSHDTLSEMRRDGLIPPDFSSIPHDRLRLAKRGAGHETVGRCPWAPPISMECVLWSGMFAALRGALGNADYLLGKELVALSDEPGPRELRFADGSAASADLVVFCDGFRSFGRRTLFPELELDYRGLVIWRGVLPESACEAGSALDDHSRLSFASMPGSFITYLMPSESGSTRPGERIVNWAAYLPVSAEALPSTMVDRDGRRREGTVPAGALPDSRERELKDLMHAELPSAFADVVERTPNTAYQPVRVCRAPAHARDRVCLVGDAAVPIQPLTGAGMFKAYENARTLTDATLASGPLDEALAEWSRTQTDLDERLLATGYALERVMIWDTMDLATAAAPDVERWWRESVDFPPEYSYLKSA